MIAQIIFEIFISWIGMGLVMFVFLVLALNIAVLCEKIVNLLNYFTKYLRARFNQP